MRDASLRQASVGIGPRGGSTGQSPCILIFGAGVRPDGSPSPTLSRRVAAAESFGRRLAAPIYIPTGGIGRHGPAEARVMAELLIEAGVPASRIVREETARDTLASVLACRQILRRLKPAGPVYAATSAYHLPRVLLLLRLAGVPARAVPPPRVPAASTRLTRWYWRLREVPALPWDCALLLTSRVRERKPAAGCN